MKFEVGDKVRLKNELIDGHLYYELLGKVGLISSIEFKFMNNYYVFFPDLPYNIENDLIHEIESESDIEKLSWTIWGDHLVAAEP